MLLLKSKAISCLCRYFFFFKLVTHQVFDYKPWINSILRCILLKNRVDIGLIYDQQYAFWWMMRHFLVSNLFNGKPLFVLYLHIPRLMFTYILLTYDQQLSLTQCIILNFALAWIMTKYIMKKGTEDAINISHVCYPCCLKKTCPMKKKIIQDTKVRDIVSIIRLKNSISSS